MAKGIFSPTSAKVFSIPASSFFLEELAKGIVAATGAKEKPEALADALIFTPNQRAARELALALYRAVGGTLLTPEIRALGDIEEEDGLAAFGPDALELPPSLSTASRRGALARLIQSWRTHQEEGPLPPSSLLTAADELATLIDQAALVGGVDWKKLDALSTELAPHLAQHWQVSASFLDIVMRGWPKYLKEAEAIDAGERRLAAAEALFTRWAAKPPKHPVIIAGSTGTGHATRRLMQAVLKLPRGIVVFPGIDPDLESWAAVADAPSHPQHAMGETLKWLGLTSQNVHAWPGGDESPAEVSRRRLINEALAPASETRNWNKRLVVLAETHSPQDLVTQALAGLSLVEAEDEAEEALAAALLLRETLESSHQTAALVTPEASLARRVAAILERWGIDIAPSSGTPLQRTSPGAFLLLLARWVRDPGNPVRLLAVLKHEFASINRSPGDLQTITSRLEREALRGPRRHASLEDLAHRLDNPVFDETDDEKQKERNERKRQALAECGSFVRDIAGLHAPAKSAFAGKHINGQHASEAIARLAEAIAGGAHVWSGKSGAMAAQFITQLGELSTAMGAIEADHFADFAETVMQRMLAPPDAAEHPRIAIWGPLEARLQRRDRMILASLNEGSWPRPAAADAFLNRTLRKQLNLPDPDERVGLSAHDFAQMANAPEVILLRARRVDDKPAVASRWLWRLRTLAAGGLGGRDEAEAALQTADNSDPLVWARAIRHVADVKPASVPKPTPPADKRALNKFSPSRAVQLIRDPYGDYAKRILRLEPLRRVGEDIDARERGTAVHLAVETFEKPGNTRTIDDLVITSLNEAGATPELIELEKPLWLRAGDAYLRWSKARDRHRVDFATEKEGKITFDSAAGPVELKAKADRVELLADGTLAMVDFKTGQPKTAAQVERGLEPQLALEAAIAARAKFGHIGPADTSELIYFRMSLSAQTMSEKNGQPLSFDTGSTMDIANAALKGLTDLINQYADPAQPYYSKPRVEFAWSVSDYDRLARRAEWTTDEGGDE